jgi:hypothetical protein
MTSANLRPLSERVPDPTDLLSQKRWLQKEYGPWDRRRRSTDPMLQAILLTSSLLLMIGMCASLMLLSAARMRREAAAPAQAPEPDA